MSWWILLAAFFALAVAPAMTAISAFTTLPELGISVSGYEDFFGADHQAQGRLAAGFVTDPVFRQTDVALALIMVGLVIALILTRGKPSSTTSKANIVLPIVLFLAIAIQAVLMIAILPRMNADLMAYRTAAKANDATAATEGLDAFNTLHPTAERLYGIRALLALGMIAASGFAAGSRREDTA